MKLGLVFWGALSFAWNLGFSRLSYGLVLPTLRHDFSGSYAIFGIVNSSNLIGYFLGMLAAPALLKKFGRPIELSAAATCTSVVAFAASAASRTLDEIAVLRFILGFASAIASILVISITMARTHGSRRGLAAGLLWAGMGFGVAICGLAAPVLAGAHPQVSWRELWLLMALAGPAILVGFTYHASRAAKVAVTPRHPNAARGDTDAHATAIVLAATFFAFGAGYIIYFTFVSALGIEYGFHPAGVGLLWEICGFSGVFGGLFAGRAMDYPIAFVVLPVVLGLGALGALLSSIHAVVAVVIGAAMMGVAFVSTPASISALLHSISTEVEYPRMLGYVTAAFAVGQFLGPVFGGVVADSSSLSNSIALSGVLMGVAATCALGSTFRSIRLHHSEGE